MWWGLMCVICCVNFYILRQSRTIKHAPAHFGQGTGTPKELAKERDLLRKCAVIFTCVCAYRSVLPRIDVPRVCFFDTFLNWTLFGRMAATVAEVCWAIQMGLVTRRLALCLEYNGAIGRALSKRVQWAGISVIVAACVAECNSWTNLTMEDDLFSVIEQALWAWLFIVTGLGMAAALKHWRGHPRAWTAFIVVAVGSGLEQGFEAFGLYLPRFRDERADPAYQFQTFWAGLQKLAECARTTQSIVDWADDAPWMSGYFSLGVWTSIWLAVAAMPDTGGGGGGKDSLLGGDAAAAEEAAATEAMGEGERGRGGQGEGAGAGAGTGTGTRRAATQKPKSKRPPLVKLGSRPGGNIT
jgi:hypothetical protein